MSENLIWVKSSLSTSQDSCVEIAAMLDGIAVRDSKDKTGPVLRFTGSEWRAFLAGVKSGEFDQ